ncbi:MAG: hypothetical protein KKG99_17280 [Bacteroidetes bacterium]|nr:hypothetical protein [Bacteroidota bacterium]
MKKIFTVIFASFLMVSTINCQTSQNDFPVLKGPYLGQKPPGSTPEIFAPGIVSTNENKEFCSTFSLNDDVFYFNREGKIMECRFDGSRWLNPVPASFALDYMEHEAHITPDGSKLFFGSRRPQPGNTSANQYGIWMMERKENGWGEPVHVGSGMYVTTSLNSNIYITSFAEDAGSLVRTVLKDGKFSTMEKLKGGVNSPNADCHPCIAPDESYIIFDSNRPGSHLGEGTFDLYVCFKLADGSWGTAINIGEKLNANAENTVASITRDGKYLFYNSKHNGTWDIYWVSTKIIEELRPK